MDPSASGRDDCRALLAKGGRGLYWFVACVTPGCSANERLDLLTGALTVPDDEAADGRSLVERVLRCVYRAARTFRAQQRLLVVDSEQTTAALHRRGDAYRRPTQADGAHLRRRLPLFYVAAICLYHLGHTVEVIAFVLDVAVDDKRIGRVYLADVVRRGLAHMIQCPRSAMTVIGLIIEGGGDPQEVLAVARAHRRESRGQGQTSRGSFVTATIDLLTSAATSTDLTPSIAGSSVLVSSRIVMLIYNKEDLAEVRQLRDELRRPNITPWIFDDEAPVGTEIYGIVDELLQGGGAFVVTIGPWGRGKWQRREMGAVVNSEMATPVVVVLLNSLGEVAKPDTGALLRNYRMVDLRVEPRTERIKEILREIVA